MTQDKWAFYRLFPLKPNAEKLWRKIDWRWSQSLEILRSQMISSKSRGWDKGNKVLCGRINKKPLSSSTSFSFPLFFLPITDSDAELQFPFKVGQHPLSLLLLPHSLSCLPGTVPYVIPIQGATARDETLVLWFHLLRFKLISSFP